MGIVVSQFPIAIARDFSLFIFAPEPDSYRSNISSILVISSTWVR